MGIKTSSNKRTLNKLAYSPGTLGEKIDKKKQALLHYIEALVQNDDITDLIEEALLPFLEELEEFNFNLGMYTAELLTSDIPFDEDDILAMLEEE